MQNPYLNTEEKPQVLDDETLDKLLASGIADPSPSVSERLEWGAAMLGPRIANTVEASGTNVGKWLGLIDPTTPIPEPIGDPYTAKSTDTFGQKATDFISHAAPFIATMEMGGAAGKGLSLVTGLSKISPLAGNIVTQASSFALPAAASSPELTAEQATQGAIFGAGAAFPRLSPARLAIAAASGALGYAFNEHENPGSGSFAGTADFIFNFFPGETPIKRLATVAKLPEVNVPPPEVLPPMAGPPNLPSYNAHTYGTGEINNFPEARLTIPEAAAPELRLASPTESTMVGPTGLQALQPNPEMINPATGLTITTEPVLSPSVRGQSLDEILTQPRIGMADTSGMKTLPEISAEEKARISTSPLNPNAEPLFVIPRKIINPSAKTSLEEILTGVPGAPARAILGGAIGALNPDEDSRTASIIGMATAGALGPMLYRHAKENPFLPDVRNDIGAIFGPAIRGKSGKIYSGKMGELHQDVIDRIPIHDATNNNNDLGFVDHNNNFLSREEAYTEAKLNKQIPPKPFSVSSNKHLVASDMGSPEALEALKTSPRTEGENTLLSTPSNLAPIAKLKTIEGFSRDELNFALGRATVGAVAGGIAGANTDDPGNNSGFAMGTLAGGLAGLFGPAAVRAAVEASGPSTKVLPPSAKIIPKVAMASEFSLGKMISEAKFNLSRGEDSLVNRAVGRLDYLFALTRGEAEKRIIAEAGGELASHADRMDGAFRRIGNMKIDPTDSEAVRKYLTGEIDQAGLNSQLQGSANQTALADFATIARRSMDGIQTILARGVGKNSRKAMILETRGKYLTTSYDLFTKGIQPTEESLAKLSAKIFSDKTWGGKPFDPSVTLSQITDSLRQWSHDVISTKGLYRPRNESTIDQTLFSKKNKAMDQEWKDFLGEVTDPIERVRLTYMKIRNAAEISNFMNKVVTGQAKSAEGLPLSYGTTGELEAARTQVANRLLDPNLSPPERSLLERQALELQQYNYQPPNASQGELQGKFINRHVADVLDEWDEASKVDSALTRHMLTLNRFMKANATYRNPLSTLTQYLTSPAFMTIGRGWSNAVDAGQIILKGDKHPMWNEILEQGIHNVDSITKDVQRDMNRLNGGLSIGSSPGVNAFLGSFHGKINNLASVARRADEMAADLFRAPDNIVRIATYLSAKARFAKELGVGMDEAIVKQKATEFTNRYTMNYDILPNAVLKGRKKPLINMFISYAYEMGRIAKNLGEDLIIGDEKGGPGSRANAVAAIALFAAAPEIMQRLSESNLSPSDRKDWETAKNLMPDYAKDQFMIVTGRDPKTKQFRVMNINRLVVAEQYQQTIRALAEGRPLDALKNNPVVGWDNNPTLNIFRSWSTHKDVHTLKELRGPVDYFATAAKEVGGPLTPGGSIPRAFHLAYDTNAEGGQGITDKRGRSMTPADFWLPFATSIRANNISLDVIQANAVAEYKTNVANELAYYKDIQKANYSKEVKEKAAERARLAIEHLKIDLADKLGMEVKLDQGQN